MRMKPTYVARRIVKLAFVALSSRRDATIEAVLIAVGTLCRILLRRIQIFRRRIRVQLIAIGRLRNTERVCFCGIAGGTFNAS